MILMSRFNLDFSGIDQVKEYQIVGEILVFKRQLATTQTSYEVYIENAEY